MFFFFQLREVGIEKWKMWMAEVYVEAGREVFGFRLSAAAVATQDPFPWLFG